MDKKDKRGGKSHPRFNEFEIKLALNMIKLLEKPIELMYYLMERNHGKPFVLILFSANEIELKKLLNKEKRATDLLFELDIKMNLFAIICQETKVDGGYRFAERLVRNLILNNVQSIYCIEVEVRSTHYGVKEVIFKAIESYIALKNKKKEGEIIFHSLG